MESQSSATIVRSGLLPIWDRCWPGEHPRYQLLMYNTIVVEYRGLPTGIYTTNNPEACQYVAHNCKANIIVVENQKQLDKILQVK